MSKITKSNMPTFFSNNLELHILFYKEMLTDFEIKICFSNFGISNWEYIFLFFTLE